MGNSSSRPGHSRYTYPNNRPYYTRTSQSTHGRSKNAAAHWPGVGQQYQHQQQPYPPEYYNSAQPYGYPQPIVPPQIPFPSAPAQQTGYPVIPVVPPQPQPNRMMPSAMHNMPMPNPTPAPQNRMPVPIVPGYPAFNGAPVVPPVPPAFTNQPTFNSEPVVPQVPFPEPERGAPVVPSHPGRDVEDMRVPIDPGQYGPRPSLFQRPKSLHFRRNPLPEPPRDVFESSPYVSLLRELRRDPEEKLHRSATLPHANGYIVTPPGQQYGSHSSRGHKERKGIFRSLSNAFGSKSRREPNRAGIPIVQPVVFAGPPIVQRTPIGTNFIYNTTPAQPPMAIPAQGTPASRMRSPVPSANVYRRDPSPAPSAPMYQRASSPAPSAHMYQRAPSPAQNAAMYQRASSPAQNAQTYQRGPSPAPLERARSPRVQRIDLSNEFAGLVHLSPHPITYDGKRYPSAFHLLEAMRFMEGSPDIAERVRNCGTVDEVRAVVHQASSLIRPDWEHIVVAKMEVVLYNKFMQHHTLRSLLLSTGAADLLYSDTRDDFWGDGPVGRGANELGRALRHVRERLRAEGYTS